jgi:hypothetical protein
VLPSKINIKFNIIIKKGIQPPDRTQGPTGQMGSIGEIGSMGNPNPYLIDRKDPQAKRIVLATGFICQTGGQWPDGTQGLTGPMGSIGAIGSMGQTGGHGPDWMQVPTSQTIAL